MNNTDLFDFIFVDRYKEQKILENYLITSTDSTLWIYGKQGFGKTEFVTYMLKKNKKYARVAQLVEYDLAKVGVAGSSPVSRSCNENCICCCGSVGRASHW